MNGDGGDIVAGAAIFAAMSVLIGLRRHWRSALRFVLKVAALSVFIVVGLAVGALIGALMFGGLFS